MRAVELPGMIPLGKPADMSEEQCRSLPVWMADQPNTGIPLVISAWMPNKEDIEAIVAGRPVYLAVVGHTMAPVDLYTTDEAGEINQ
jgi:hypothetical protein